MLAKDFCYLLDHETIPVLIWRIPHPGSNVGHMVNGHFVNDSFLTILEDIEPMENMIRCIHVFNEATKSKLQATKT